MTVAATASVPTTNGSRYLQQLCKHWSHNLTVEFSREQGRVVFPRDGRAGSFAADGVLILEATPDTLRCRIEASEPAQLNALQDVVSRHLDRFAFREAPLVFDWRAE